MTSFERYSISWVKTARIYLDRRVMTIFLLGISSGFPLGVIGDPLTAWLQEHGLSKTTIGLFALAGLPYSLKFLWAPILDQTQIPWLTTGLGRRRGWMILAQVMLLIGVGFLGLVILPDDVHIAAVITFLIAFFSASQDIVIDAYRVEVFEDSEMGAGAASIVFGYRLGQVGAGAFGLLIASSYGWAVSFWFMATIALVGLVAVVFSAEPTKADKLYRQNRLNSNFRTAIFEPLADFLRRPGWIIILGVIVLFKLGDSVLSVMQTPFFLELGFSKIEIAGIKKGVGFSAVIIGGFLGGIIVANWGSLRSLLLCGVLQALSNLIFVFQAMAGHDLTALAVTVATENLATGMGSVAFVAYLSGLCNQLYTATQYALLTSIMGGSRTFLSAISGWLADSMDWISFFILTTVFALPGLALIVWLLRRFTPTGNLRDGS